MNEIIRGLRQDNDEKQTDIAALLGISQQYYSKYELGDYEIPMRHLIALAGHYGVSLDYLAGQTSFPKRFEELDRIYIKGVTTGEFLHRALSLDSKARVEAVSYVDYLAKR